MKPRWILFGVLMLYITGVKAPDPKITGSKINQMRRIAEDARLKYLLTQKPNPQTVEKEITSVKKAPLDEGLKINIVAKTSVGTDFHIVSVSGSAISDIVKIGLGIVTQSGTNFESIYDSVGSTDNFEAETTVNFPSFDLSSLTDGEETLLVLTARDVNDEPIAAGSLYYVATDLTPTALDRVGANHDGDVTIRLDYTGKTFTTTLKGLAADICQCTVYPCYCVGHDMTNEVSETCTTMTTLDSAAGTFQLCDKTVTATDAFTGVTVNTASLLYTQLTTADLTIDSDFAPASETVEVVYYQATEKAALTSVSCELKSTTCTTQITDITEQDIDNRILVVGLTGGAVTSSGLHNFEDYKLKLKSLSATTLEARWSAVSAAVFEVTVDSGTTLTVSCDGTNCIAYFTGLDSSTTYTISLKQSGGDNTVGDSAQPQADGSIVQFTIDELTKMTVGNPTPISVTVTPASSVVGATDITFAFTVEDPTPVTQYVQQILSPDPINDPTTFDFQLEEAALLGTTVTVNIVAHDANSVILAAGEVASFPLLAVSPHMNWVGAAAGATSPKPSLRVNNDVNENIIVDGQTCPQGVSYFLEHETTEEEPIRVCTEVVTPTLVCDKTQTINPFTNIALLSTISLSYDINRETSMVIDATFDSLSQSMDILLYTGSSEDARIPCDISGSGTIKTCPFTEPVPTSPFNILLVGLSALDDQVIESSATSLFENYATIVTQLTLDLMEVRWTAATEAVYNIYLDKTVSDAYNTVTVTCGDTISDKCKAFFMMLKQETYVASVKLDTGGELNIVAAAVAMTSVSEALTILSLTLDDQGETLQAKVCFQDHAGGTNNYELNMIDRSGKVRTSQLGNADNSCITGLVLDTTFSTASEVRVLVTSEDGTNRTAGDVDLFLLDPNLQTGNARMSVKQVGQATLRVKWTNLNNAFNYQIAQDTLQNTPVQCAFRKECGEYVHLDNPQGSVAVTLTENGTVKQIVTTSVDIQTSIQDIVISSISTRYDNRIQVCFDAPTDIASYELGLEVSNELLEATEDPQIINGDNGASCVLSDNTVELGAYVELWCLVSAYDDAGNLKASGVQMLKSIFLSASRAVYGAVSNTSLISSWHLLDSVQGINQITVYLKALTDQGANVINTVNFAPNVTSHIFDISEGKYTICVQASTEDLYSEEICSDIIKVLAGQDVVVPPVETTPPKTTSDNEVLVTWHPPQDEDVTGFLVSWSEILGLQASRPAFNSPEVRNGLFTPLDLVRAVSKPRAVGETGFMIVSASETSVEITALTSGSKYSLCVASVKEDMVGSQDCNESDLSQYEQLDAPTNLNYFDNGTISWQGDESSTYLVQWQSKTDTRERGFTEINGTTYEKTFVPGQWAIEVRTVTKTSSSEATGATILIAGLVTYAKQSQETSLIATWYEEETQTSMISDLNEKLYEIRVLQNGISIGSPVPVYCSAWLAECSYEIHNLNMSFTDEVTVSVTDKDANINANYVLKIRDFTEIAMLSKTVRSSNDVEVAWNEVPEAEGYKITLYKAVPSNEIKYQDFIPMNQIQLTEDNMYDNVFTVQACKGEEHCGNLAHITLAQDPGDNGPSKTTVIIASTVSAVVGVALILVIVAAVMRNKSKKSKTRGNRGSGEEPIYDTWGKRPLGQSKKRADPQELPRAPSSRENYGIPSTFDVHS